MTESAAEGKRRADDAAGARAGAVFLILSTAVVLVYSTWHPKLAIALSGAELAEAMVAAQVWSQMHLLGALGFALLASAALILMSKPGAFGTGPAVRTALSFAFVGALVSSIGTVVDGQRAFIAPAVLRGEDVGVFTALTYLWDDRGLAVISAAFLAVGAAVLSAAQLVTPTVSPRWASAVALLGTLTYGVFTLSGFGLRVFLPPVLAIGGVPAFGWFILAAALALKRSTDAADAP